MSQPVATNRHYTVSQHKQGQTVPERKGTGVTHTVKCVLRIALSQETNVWSSWRGRALPDPVRWSDRSTFLRSHVFHHWWSSRYFAQTHSWHIVFQPLHLNHTLPHFLLCHIINLLSPPCCLFPASLFSWRCSECGCILSHWYYEREGQLYCKKHYWARYGEHCHGCKDTISTGLIMVTC